MVERVDLMGLLASNQEKKGKKKGRDSRKDVGHRRSFARVNELRIESRMKLDGISNGVGSGFRTPQYIGPTGLPKLQTSSDTKELR